MNSTASDLVLDVRDLAVTYADGTRALDRINLSVERGKCLAIVGESGCGKSTFLAAVLGLLPRHSRTQGSVLVGGIDVTRASPRQTRRVREAHLGYVPQDPHAAVDPLRPVLHHIRFAARSAKCQVDALDIATRLAMVGIDPETVASRKWPHQWSGGMLQRACIVAATIVDPPLVLADEPTSALDHDTAAAVLRDLRARVPSLVMVTHDLDAAALVADDVAVISQGRIVEQGPAGRILNHPEHAYTVSLIDAVHQIRRSPS